MRLKLQEIDPVEVMSKTSWNELTTGHDEMVIFLKDMLRILKPSISETVLNARWTADDVENGFYLTAKALEDVLNNHKDIGYALKKNKTKDGIRYHVEIGIGPSMVDDCLYAMPLSWMDSLFRINRPLFKLAADVLRRVIYEKGMSLGENFMEDMICSDPHGWVEGIDDEDVQEKVIKELSSVDKETQSFQKLIWKPVNKFKTDKAFLKALESFKEQGCHEVNLGIAAILEVIEAFYKTLSHSGRINWISEEGYYQAAVRSECLIKDEDTGDEYIEFCDGDPLKLENQITFVWSNNEHFKAELLNWVTETGRSFGDAIPYDEKVCNEPVNFSEVLKSFREEKGYLIESICSAMDIFGKNEDIIYKYCNEPRIQRTRKRRIHPEKSLALL